MYTDEVNCQIVIALLKAHGIRKVIANPGATNIAFVGSIQNDPWFEVYSGVDERHSAYLACGMAAESGVPVVLSCTGATASRNYIPALTEAFYRKLPVLALTSSQVRSHIGQLHPQMIDRTVLQNDIAKISVECPIVKDEDDFALCEREVNRAILELTRKGGGPAHINMETTFSHCFAKNELPIVRRIYRWTQDSETWPNIDDFNKIVVWIGSHQPFDDQTSCALEDFVKSRNAVVLKDGTSGYNGYGGIFSGLLCSQPIRDNKQYLSLKPDLIIHIGEVSGDYFTDNFLAGSAPVWRVNLDGEIRTRLGNLSHVFEMSEKTFFRHYSKDGKYDSEYYKTWQKFDADIRAMVPEVPFSNNYIAHELCTCLPKGSVLHMGILSSLRSCGLVGFDRSINGYCNVGGFGIDGNMSTLIGASLVHPDKLYFGIFGDLSFFYDLNALGNRHIGKNLRIVLVNNGEGAEFSLYGSAGVQFKAHTADYIGAGGHFGRKSRSLVRDFAISLGFTYLSASDKVELSSALNQLVAGEADKSIVLECFVEMSDEKEACRLMSQIVKSSESSALKHAVGKFLPHGMKNVLRSVISP